MPKTLILRKDTVRHMGEYLTNEVRFRPSSGVKIHDEVMRGELVVHNHETRRLSPNETAVLINDGFLDAIRVNLNGPRALSSSVS